MYILCSKFEEGVKNLDDKVKNKIKRDMKVAILPWAFPKEINSDLLLNNYFKKGTIRYNRYVDSLINLGLKEENMTILDCYEKNIDIINNKLIESDIILLPGGNPEMLYDKLFKLNCKSILNKNDKIIIGESAGALVLFDNYFITKENNFYNKLDYYKGLGIIENTFYIDVHSLSEELYQKELKNVLKKVNRIIYAIHNDGILVLDDTIKLYGMVDIIV